MPLRAEVGRAYSWLKHEPIFTSEFSESFDGTVVPTAAQAAPAAAKNVENLLLAVNKPNMLVSSVRPKAHK